MSSEHAAAASAANRFGLGARPGDLSQIHDAVAWLWAQTQRAPAGSDAFDGLPGSLDYLQREAELTRRRRTLRRDAVDAPTTAGTGGNAATAEGKPDNPLARLYVMTFGDDLRREAVARWQVAVSTETPFSERLVRFWSNHFAVSVDKGPTRLYAAPMEREAIRPHVNGRFVDLLLAVETHPAMLRYLDQAQSVGPDSRLARRVDARTDDRAAAGAGGRPARKLGLNENLGREIMELHTLGVDGGYTQADVTEFSRALTGWSLPAPIQLERGIDVGSAFVFRPGAHEPGTRTVLGRRYSDDGMQQARAILADLALHPATAKHLATQLARHFVADNPPPALIERMARAYRDSGGELTALYSALIHSPQAWAADARKFRTPQDFVVAGLRAGVIAIGAGPQPWEGLLQRLGQPTFMPRSPSGYTDVAGDWIAPDALWKRVQIAQAMAERVSREDLDPPALARAVLGPALHPDTLAAMAHAEAPQQAVTILFASPDFQWRV
ncbi:MAG TPA: DUF1800 domain-containing protein [Steroidobacteraceae bacterium]|nr:DUF1800 domain-containing protein [Steroidobacteraceae bacterium]